MSLSPQVLITCAPEKETLIMTPAEKEKIITENRSLTGQPLNTNYAEVKEISKIHEKL